MICCANINVTLVFVFPRVMSFFPAIFAIFLLLYVCKIFLLLYLFRISFIIYVYYMLYHRFLLRHRT